MKNKRIPVSKRIIACSICSEELKGNGSFRRPYQCSCGTWKGYVDADHEWVYGVKEDK